MFYTDEICSYNHHSHTFKKQSRGGKKNRGKFPVQLILTCTEGKYLTTFNCTSPSTKSQFWFIPPKKIKTQNMISYRIVLETDIDKMNQG